MRYEMMLPHHIKTAIDEDWPVVLPLGPLEYHGQHMSVGMDTLVRGPHGRAPGAGAGHGPAATFWWGPASYAVEARSSRAPCRWRPSTWCRWPRTSSAASCASASATSTSSSTISPRTSIRACPRTWPSGPERACPSSSSSSGERGEGWWGSNEMANYYADHERGANPFNWISGHPLMDEAIIAEYPFDHAGYRRDLDRCWSSAPETVDMERLDTSKWYLESARDANRELGAKGASMVLERMRQDPHRVTAGAVHERNARLANLVLPRRRHPRSRGLDRRFGHELLIMLNPNDRGCEGRDHGLLRGRRAGRAPGHRRWRRGGCAASASAIPSTATRSRCGQYALKLDSRRCRVICQIGRMDVQQPNLAYYTVMGHPTD